MPAFMRWSLQTCCSGMRCQLAVECDATKRRRRRRAARSSRRSRQLPPPLQAQVPDQRRRRVVPRAAHHRAARVCAGAAGVEALRASGAHHLMIMHGKAGDRGPT
jgi:hypothetical protein